MRNGFELASFMTDVTNSGGQAGCKAFVEPSAHWPSGTPPITIIISVVKTSLDITLRFHIFFFYIKQTLIHFLGVLKFSLFYMRKKIKHSL